MIVLKLTEPWLKLPERSPTIRLLVTKVVPVSWFPLAEPFPRMRLFWMSALPAPVAELPFPDVEKLPITVLFLRTADPAPVVELPLRLPVPFPTNTLFLISELPDVEPLPLPVPEKFPTGVVALTVEAPAPPVVPNALPLALAEPSPTSRLFFMSAKPVPLRLFPFPDPVKLPRMLLLWMMAFPPVSPFPLKVPETEPTTLLFWMLAAPVPVLFWPLKERAVLPGAKLLPQVALLSPLKIPESVPVIPGSHGLAAKAGGADSMEKSAKALMPVNSAARKGFIPFPTFGFPVCECLMSVSL